MNYNAKTFASSAILDAIAAARDFINTLPLRSQGLTKFTASDGRHTSARVVVFYPDGVPEEDYYPAPSTSILPITFNDDKGHDVMVNEVLEALNAISDNQKAFAQLSASNGEGVKASFTLWY